MTTYREIAGAEPTTWFDPVMAYVAVTMAAADHDTPSARHACVARTCATMLAHATAEMAGDPHALAVMGHRLGRAAALLHHLAADVAS